ncbi:MAG TPA: metal ABC transporter permease [Leptolyngbyaceae cyanobacterium M33_DOE_097]|uniref:Metal ABC transporter permease n=1 Tax=Oscillatoriales cyanobacterium SpSt-418 TaxID=2282169 RepID=A0A7C3PQZ9_9CYAN|nr:metal ABC transporter permease [Leptolyngbyaceae cyanobacterium M33_DOE_097]
MIEALQFDFMRNALIAGTLVSVACGIIGTFVVINRIVFISGGIAHAAYGGIGLGYFFKLSPVLGAVIFSVAAALGMGIVQRRTHQRADTMIGVMWAIGMAIGIILIDLTEGYKADLMSYLFGSILTVTSHDLLIMLILDIVIVILAIAFYRELLAISFDEVFATISNVPVNVIYLTLMCMIALTIVMMMRVVGLIMVIALLTMPAAISGQYMKSMKKMMALASLLGIVFTTSGLWLSYLLNLTSGATIILVAGLGYCLSAIAQLFKKRLSSAAIREAPTSNQSRY